MSSPSPAQHRRRRRWAYSVGRARPRRILPPSRIGMLVWYDRYGEGTRDMRQPSPLSAARRSGLDGPPTSPAPKRRGNNRPHRPHCPPPASAQLSGTNQVHVHDSRRGRIETNRPQPSANRPRPKGTETPGQAWCADGADGADGSIPLSLARGGHGSYPSLCRHGTDPGTTSAGTLDRRGRSRAAMPATGSAESSSRVGLSCAAVSPEEGMGNLVHRGATGAARPS
jgi:hypothetical protein